MLAKAKLRTTKVYGYLQTNRFAQTKRLPCVKGAVAKRLRDCFTISFLLLQSLRQPSAATSLYTREAFFYLPEGKQKCLCVTFVIAGCLGFLLILLFFWIKFGETTQIVVALVATTFKALLSVTKTNGRLSGHKFYAGNIYYLFENILTHTFLSSAYKKVHPRRNAPKKCFPSNVATQTLSDTV